MSQDIITNQNTNFYEFTIEDEEYLMSLPKEEKELTLDEIIELSSYIPE